MTIPSNQEFERIVLGGILIDDSIHEQIFDVLRPEDFYSERHRLNYEAKRGLYAAHTPVDFLTVSVAKDIKANNWEQYLVDAASAVGTAANWEHYCKELRKLATARRGIKAGQTMIDALSSGGPIEHAIDQAQQIVLGLDNTLSHGRQYTARDLAHESMQRYKDLSEHGRGSGISTGYPSIDELLGGGFRRVFAIIAGRPGQGKTALATNMAFHQARDGHGVGIISLEMGRDELWNRIIAMRALINTVKLDNGRLNGEDWDAIIKANSDLSKCHLIIDDSPGGQPVAEVRRLCRRLKKRGAEIIYIDQLSKIRGQGKGLYETNTNVVNELSPLAKELEIPIVLLAQINREAVAQGNKRPSLNHLKATGALEEDADIVLFVHREFEYTRDEEKKYEASIELAKHRGGPTGSIEMRWVGKYTRFEEA